MAQTFEDVEIIISDNCSADATEAICREFAQRDSRIRYLRQPENLGAIANFNHVFAEARGEYFKWAAYDDLCEPTFLQRCVDVLDKNPDVGWCHSKSDRIDADGGRLTGPQSGRGSSVGSPCDDVEGCGHPRKNCDSSRASQRFAGVILGTNWCVDSYGLIRAEALRRTCMLLPFYGAEKVLMGELALQGPYHHIPERLFSQRIHPVASSNLKSAAFQSAFMVGSRAKTKLPARLAILTAHFKAAVTANLPLRQRAECAAVVVRYVLQFGKWKRVMAAAASGRGVGGDGIERLQSVEASRQERAT